MEISIHGPHRLVWCGSVWCACIHAILISRGMVDVEKRMDEVKWGGVHLTSSSVTVRARTLNPCCRFEYVVQRVRYVCMSAY
jgi:hypothetical protein